MAKTNTHAIVGIGDNKVSREAVYESLKDVLDPDDVVSIVWRKPITPAVEFVYDYVMDNSVLFQMYYEEGQNPSRVFRESEHGSVFKVREPEVQALKSITGSGKVLYLWDDEEATTLIDTVFDTIDKGTLVLELTNGLTPIVAVDEEPTLDEQAPKGRYDDDEEPDDDVAAREQADSQEKKFTKAELEAMPAVFVKRYGAEHGAKAKTAKGIIEELFPDPSDDEPEPGEVLLADERDLIQERVEAIKAGTEEAHADKTISAADAWKSAFTVKALREIVSGLNLLIDALTYDGE